jgi:cytosine/adenosine deaminase-related metal-dependent hydrolase
MTVLYNDLRELVTNDPAHGDGDPLGIIADETTFLGGAAALRRGDVGVLAAGRRADFVRLDAPSHLHLAYRPGVPLVRDVVKNGQRSPSSRKNTERLESRS